jgi:hypothetical protein
MAWVHDSAHDRHGFPNRKARGSMTTAIIAVVVCAVGVLALALQVIEPLVEHVAEKRPVRRSRNGRLRAL